METWQLLGLNNCDTCRRARTFLKDQGMDVQLVDYRKQVPSTEQLLGWASRVGGFQQVVNKASTTWRQLPPELTSPTSDSEWTQLIQAHPTLIKRPVLIGPHQQLVFGFKADQWSAIIRT